jgi:hypothetical protein
MKKQTAFVLFAATLLSTSCNSTKKVGSTLPVVYAAVTTGETMLDQLQNCPDHDEPEDYDVSDIVDVFLMEDAGAEARSALLVATLAFERIHNECVRTQFEQREIRKAERKRRLGVSRRFRTAVSTLDRQFSAALWESESPEISSGP